MKYCDTCGTALVLGYCPRCKEDFALSNPPPKPAKWKGVPSERCRQTVMLTGLSLLPNQQDLFQVDGS